MSPNRLLLFPLTLVLSLAAGLFASFAASQIRPVFFDARSLREASGLPLLGKVSMRVDEAKKQNDKRNFRRFIAGCVSFLGAYAAGIAVLFFITMRTA